MIEDSYQKVFYEFTRTLDQVPLGRVCLDHNVNVSYFLAWVDACKVRQAKMWEVTESRIAAMEKAR